MSPAHPAFNPEFPRVCVIGAGPSGLAVAKALKDARVPFACFERGDRVGGNWVFKSSSGLSSAYRSLHINTSRKRMEYRAFPMPESYPDFAHHTLLARYFDDYAEHFALKPFIQFGTTVEHVEPRADGTYRVRLNTTTAPSAVDDGRHELFDVIAVCNGHHTSPRWPSPRFPGKFAGVELHSHEYIDPHEPYDFVGKRVIVVGMGNSAMDIACELGHPGHASEVYVAARRGAWVVPKYLFGKPFDEPPRWFPSWLPLKARLALARYTLELVVGKMEDFGLPRPDHDPGQAHPTISSEFLTRVGSGDIAMKPNIKALEGPQVRFADDSVVEADFIIYCTGYNVTFPFFERDFLSAPNNDLPLFRRALKPDLPGLFFAGLCQPLGAIMPIAEAQGSWLADYVRGLYLPPSSDEMLAEIEREREAMRARYVSSPRHTMQIDFQSYLDDLEQERRAGARRAQLRDYRLPIPPRARHG